MEATASLSPSRKKRTRLLLLLLLCLLLAGALLYRFFIHENSASDASIIGTWKCDTSMITAEVHYWGESHTTEALRNEFSRYIWSFHADSTCSLQMGKSGSLVGTFQLKHDTCLLLYPSGSGNPLILSIVRLTGESAIFGIKEIQTKAVALSDSEKNAVNSYYYTLRFIRVNAADSLPDKGTDKASVNPETAQPDNRLAIARADFDKKVAVSNGAVVLNSFVKTNGYESSPGGQNIYVLEFMAKLKVTRTIYKSGDGIMGYWNSFYVMKTAREQNSFFPGKRFDAGINLELSGEYYLHKTENGWFADSYKLKRQRWY